MRRPAAWMLMFRLATAAATQEAATGPKQVKITVLAYDFVGLNRDTRRDSSRKLGEIFQPAGIPIEWVDCQSGKQLLSEARCRNLERTDVFLRLVDGGDVKAKDVHVNYLGITEPEWGGRGRITILTRNIEEMKNGSVWQYPELLAHAVAHELGHIFGLRDHNSAGLMSTNWSRTTFRRMTQEGMRLSSVEIRGLQQSMRERMRR